MRTVTIKKSTTFQELFKRCPSSEFVTYMEYVRNLKFDEKPNYFYINDLFQRILERNGHS